jgi:hypothetical protein
MADALKNARGRPRKYSNPESARLAKQKYDRERKQKLQRKPTAESDNDAPLIPPLQAIPLRTALKRTSPPSSFINTFPQFASPKKTLPPQAPSPKKTPPQAPSRKEPSIERSPSPSNQLFDNWDNAVYNDDNNDDYSGHTDEGSGGGHTEEGHIDDEDSEGGYIKEEAYIEEEEEDIYDVSDREREAQRGPRRNQDPQAPIDPRNHRQEDPRMDELATHLEEQTLISQLGLAPHPNSSEIDDSLAGQLAEQLYSFHGCTTDAHNACDDKYTQSPDSYTSIPELLRSQKPGGSIPDVLKLPKFMEKQDLDNPALLQQLYEGWSPTREPELEPESGLESELESEPKSPKKLYLPHKLLERQNRRLKTTYDIDSLCLFPTSLAVARQGLFWQPLSHNILNIALDVHFTMPADFYITNKVTKEKRLKNGPRPLHQIVHCCLGTISGFEGLRLYAFFPKISHPNRTTTYLRDDEKRLWLDSVFFPALYAEHKGEEGVLQHFPASHKVAQANALSHGTERTVFDHEMHLSRQQLLEYFIQPEKLAGIWERVLATIEDTPALAVFKGVTLFATAKDLKLRYMSALLPTVSRKWKQHYKWAINPAFQARKQAFIDLGKQVTAEGSYLFPSTVPDYEEPTILAGEEPIILEPTIPAGEEPPILGPTIPAGEEPSILGPTIPAGEEPSILGPTIPAGEEPSILGPTIPAGEEPQTFVFKRCCLESFFQWYCPTHSDRKGKKKEEDPDNRPQRNLYSNFLTKDATNMTIHFPNGSKERAGGYVYLQQYSEVHAPFNAAKLTPFANKGFEHLAVDPSLVDAISHAGKAIVFNQKTCERGYLNSKKRANYTTRDAQYKSYGTREEHRISLELFDEMLPKFVGLSQREEPTNCNYYYTIPSETLFGFLRTQINKFCLGFEHLYTQGTVVPWEKSQLMVYFLRMLRLCYGAHNLGQERELFRDKWEIKDENGDVLEAKEGLGLQRTISYCGLGWFLPKINWEAWNLLPTHAQQMVIDNPRIRKAYHKQWKAVGLLFEGATLVNEARTWAQKFNVTSTEHKKKLWLHYLYAINLQVFHEVIGSTIAKDLKPEYRQRASNGQLSLCWNELSNAWAVGRPHCVGGNRMHYKDGPMGLVDYLFDFNDTSVRGGWANSKYRLIYQQTLGLIEEVDSKARAEEWGRQFKKLVIFTCWLLPYPSKDVLFDRTKRQGGRPSERMWFSSYHDEQSDELMGLYDSRANSDEGDDFQALLRFTHIYCHWQTGRKNRVLYGRPLKSKMVLEIQGLSLIERERYFANLMS